MATQRIPSEEFYISKEGMHVRAPKRILSIDMPGGREGGWVFQDLAWSDNEEDTGLTCGPILFSVEKSLADDFLVLANLLDGMRPQLVVLEQGFLFQIEKYLGGVLALCAERKIKWFQIGPSRAKKLVLGHGKASKDDVLAWARQTHPDLEISSFHIADSLLYLEAWRKERTQNARLKNG